MIRLGRPDVKPDKPSHIRGVHEGNGTGNYERQPGHLRDGSSTQRRSTGVNPSHREPILDSMPNLSPA
ncbi:hypothetical protein [Actinomadura monticuli]|uniref:Uncharacterized protein n=1 Tax=Actinomadura monticuli TaxID=3097367 RepID=A0ABV4QEG2_9ACTN